MLQQVIDGLVRRQWDVQRAIDHFPEGAQDDVLFARAGSNGRVFVTKDARIQGTGENWLENGRPFTGLIFWPRKHYKRMTDGDIIREIEKLAEQDTPFAYPIVRIKPDK